MSPSQVFSKLVFILETIKQHFIVNLLENTLEAKTSDLAPLAKILEYEYSQFMELYRREYASIYIQYVTADNFIVSEAKTEKFLSVCAVYDVIAFIMTLFNNLFLTF